MHFRRVDLPEPLRPRIPIVWPASNVGVDVPQGPEVLEGNVAGVKDPLFQRGVLLVVEAEPLRDALDVDGVAHASSELLGEVALDAAEDEHRAEEEHDSDTEEHASMRRRSGMG